jgi:hypothetical protein
LLIFKSAIRVIHTNVLRLILGSYSPHLKTALQLVTCSSQTIITHNKTWWSLHIEVLLVSDTARALGTQKEQPQLLPQIKITNLKQINYLFLFYLVK